ncbi:NAD-dependent epimerase/dehydratase family protein [Cryomorpha ignava]|uniref:NAD-dependent epimerase/dehydratase family protein n=1 Tax=Cryomorpha ignava TaxID=101383 RepID=A0A7K3WKI8_9FLAO|nr:NAD-dependent epimerase/dehydratase family protein [Cryomorpha ignava]NEN22163.1 NAD-dependent epimerase/dehydratase family protein [Cryomorpha ignava]
MKTIGIIGGSGFIGSHVTKKFLEEGYKVKVSATDLSNTEKYGHLKNLPNAENLEILSLKVENSEELKNFIDGCTILVHGGTPFQLDFKDAKTELFDPTIEGTKNLLRIINETMGIEKVVFVASVAAFNTNFPLPAGGMDVYESFDENTPAFISKESHPYAQAKYLANKTVEAFIEDHKNLPFEITSVSPVLVMGNSLSKREDSTSTALQFLIKNHIAPNDFIQGMYDSDMALSIVDVEDVADAIYKAANTNGIHGKNYLLVSETYPVSDVRSMLNKLKPKNNPRIVYQNELAKTDLKVRFKPVMETLNNYAT